jgi:hypothetical protein
MSTLHEVLDRLNAVRNHKGTVRVSIDNHTADAAILGTEVVDGYLHASFQIQAEAKELVRLQNSVIDQLMHFKAAEFSIRTPGTFTWQFAESIEILTNERGLYLWTVHMRLYE